MMTATSSTSTQRTPVNSSNIRAVGWKDQKLEVEFHHSGVYVYSEVPLSVYEQMIAAPSVGKFFLQEVKNRYQHEKVSALA